MKYLFNVLIVSVFVIVVSIHVAKAQFIRFDHFDTKTGLSQNNINSLIVDSTGFVWVGTIEGITRFDGSNFDVFRSNLSQQHTLPGNYIEDLSACPNGNIWVRVQNRGLCLFEAATEKFITFSNDQFLPADVLNLTSFVSVNDSVLWLTDLAGFYHYNLSANRLTKLNIPFLRGNVIYGGKDEVLYVGKGGIVSYSVKTARQIRQITSLPIRRISQVYNDSLVAIISDGLKVLNLKNDRLQAIESTELNKILEENVVLSVAGYKNEVWIGLNDGLLFVRLNGGTVRFITKYSYDPFNEYSFHGQDAKKLTFDKAGNLWIGTSKYGMNLYCREKNAFKHHQISALSKADQEIDPIRAICKTKDGNIWVGFDRSGLVCIRPDAKQKLYSEIHFSRKPKEPLENIRSLYQDSNGDLWVGSNHGLCKYNQKKDLVESVTAQYSWDWPDVCYHINESTPGKLTITNFSGIGIVDLKAGSLEKVPMDKSYTPASIRSLAKDKHNNYWFIIGDLGLYKLSPDHTLKLFTYEKNNLTDNKLYSLEIVGDSLWIGSNNGLMAFDLDKEKVVSRFFEEDGLSNNLVYSVIHSNGQLWMSTNRGISRLNLKNKHIEKFLTDDLFMDDAYFRDKNGTIYFGGYDGFISFNPEHIKEKAFVPHAEITDLYINNHKVVVGEKIRNRIVLSSSIKNLDEIKMNYSTSSFFLTFNAFPFNYPDLTYFRYRLVGLSSDWILAAKRENRAMFTNLAPGHYVFELEASADGLNWSEPRKLVMAIVPPFYMTLWFKLLLVSIVLVIIFITYKVRLLAIKKWNLELERQIREQTLSIEAQKNKIIEQKENMLELNERLREADQAKLKYYTNLSHEFRTPLTIIMGYIDTLQQQGANLGILKKITKSSDRLYSLVNQFIDLRKYDQGELRLNVSNFDLVAFTNEIVDSYKDLALKKNINLEFLGVKDKLFLWLDSDKTDKIIYNILSNAIKYTDSGGTVIVSIDKCENGVNLKVSDSGIGMSKEEQRNIFDHFYRSPKVSSQIDGHGIGLTLVKALVEIQHGSIECISEEGVGTTINIQFKSGNKHFKKSEINQEKPASPVVIREISAPTVIESGNPLGNRLLVVEDNPELSEYLSDLLGKYYKVETAANGKEALMKLDKNIPDLILTDLMMPVMDGISLAKALREMPKTRFIPIIVLSAKTDVTSKIEGFQTNIDDYIEKPFNPSLLLSRIGNILSRNNEIKNDVEQFAITQNEKLNQSDKSFMQKVLLILEKNYSNPEFNADELSNELGMSRVTFYRKMKKLDQEGPGELIRKYRLKKALKMMDEGRKTINEICIEVGFQSLSNFRKSFKERYGALPSKYLDGKYNAASAKIT
jgi:Signal transduction histidine kinase